MMKPLVVFFSRSGNTKRAAEAIASALKAETEQIWDKKKRSGPFGFFSAGKDAATGKTTKIEPTKNNPSSFGLVVVGTPIWAGNMAPAVRAFLEQNRGKFKKVAFFCTAGGGTSGNAFGEMSKLLGLKPVSTLELSDKEKPGETERKAKAFVQGLS